MENSTVVIMSGDTTKVIVISPLKGTTYISNSTFCMDKHVSFLLNHPNVLPHILFVVDDKLFSMVIHVTDV